MKDYELIEKSIKGDHSAFKELVLRYGPYLLTTCRRYSFSPYSGEDILQDAFVKIYNNLKKYDSKKGTFISYCTRICINTAISKRDKNQRREEIRNNIKALSPHAHEPRIIDHLNAEDIIKFINNLPINQAHVFNLFVIEGYSHKEISDLLQISPAASRTMLKRAKEKLRARISISENKSMKDGSI